MDPPPSSFNFEFPLVQIMQLLFGFFWGVHGIHGFNGFSGNILSLLANTASLSLSVGFGNEFVNINLAFLENLDLSNQNSGQWEDFLSSFHQLVGHGFTNNGGSEVRNSGSYGNLSQILDKGLSNSSNLGSFSISVCSQLALLSGGECGNQASEDITVLGFDISDNVDQSHLLSQEGVELLVDH